jgi:hypothetical protein
LHVQPWQTGCLIGGLSLGVLGPTTATALFIGDLAEVLALSVWDAIDSYHSAQARNRDSRARRLAVCLVPGSGPSNVSAAGHMLAGQF